MSRRESSEAIDAAAADWAMRIDAAPLDAAGQAEFETWLDADMRRVGAYARAQAVLVHVKRAKALGSAFEPAAFDAAELQPVEGVEPIDGATPEPASPTRRRVLIGGGLAIAASGVAAIFVPIGRATARTYATAKGEIRMIPLADGSTVTLNSDSRIATRIAGSRREVDLIGGEALFKVAAAGRLPFTVDAGDTSLRADAATFAICRLDRQPLQVQVCEGKVEIARATAGRQSLVLHANMQAVMPFDGSIVDRAVTADALARDLAWQEGMLSFEDTPLRAAAEEFARYSDRHILVDRSIGAETVTGRFAANNPAGFARAVALGLDLRVRQTADGILLGR